MFYFRKNIWMMLIVLLRNLSLQIPCILFNLLQIWNCFVADVLQVMEKNIENFSNLPKFYYYFLAIYKLYCKLSVSKPKPILQCNKSSTTFPSIVEINKKTKHFFSSLTSIKVFHKYEPNILQCKLYWTYRSERSANISYRWQVCIFCRWKDYFIYFVLTRAFLPDPLTMQMTISSVPLEFMTSILYIFISIFHFSVFTLKPPFLPLCSWQARGARNDPYVSSTRVFLFYSM